MINLRDEAGFKRWREDRDRRRRRDELNFGGGGRSPYIDKLLNTEPDNLVALFAPSMSGITDISPHGYSVTPSNVSFGSSTVAPGVEAGTYNGTSSYSNIHSAGLANDNLLANPGFETAGAGGADIWANWNENLGDGALANETTIIHEGVDAAKITSGALLNTSASQSFTVVPGKKYRLRFWTRGDGTYGGRYQLYDATNSTTITGVAATGIVGATYTVFTKEFTAPAGCISILGLVYGPATNTGIAYFDACEVRCMDGFLGDEGTLLAWAKVSAAGVWTDATARQVSIIRETASNIVSIGRTTTNGQFIFNYISGATTKSVTISSQSDIVFVCYAMTWSKSGDAFKAYKAGTQEGATQTGLGVWSGTPINTRCNIGADITTPGGVWSGSIGPVALWNTALTAAQILANSSV